MVEQDLKKTIANLGRKSPDIVSGGDTATRVVTKKPLTADQLKQKQRSEIVAAKLSEIKEANPTASDAEIFRIFSTAEVQQDIKN